MLCFTLGSLFAPKNSEHVKVLKRNEKAMTRLLRVFQTMVISACVCLALHLIVGKAMGQELSVIIYFPFDISKSPQ